MRIVNVLIGAVLAAGFEGAEAAVIYRALGDFALYWSGGEAAFLALDEQAAADRPGRVDPRLPGRGRGGVPAHLADPRRAAGVTDDDIFETILSLVMAGLLQRAPRPCACEAHR